MPITPSPTPEPTPERAPLETILEAWLDGDIAVSDDDTFVDFDGKPLPFGFVAHGTDFSAYRAFFLGATKLDNEEVIALFGFHDSNRRPFTVAMRLGTTTPGSPVFVLSAESRVHDYLIDQEQHVQTNAKRFYERQAEYVERSVYFSTYEVAADSPWPGLDDALAEGVRPAIALSKFMRRVRNTPLDRVHPVPEFVNTVPDSHEGIPFVAQLTFRPVD